MSIDYRMRMVNDHVHFLLRISCSVDTAILVSLTENQAKSQFHGAVIVMSKWHHAVIMYILIPGLLWFIAITFIWMESYH